MLTQGVKVPKAYNNTEFMNSRKARNIRILCEYQETQERLDTQHVSATILVFGSARCYDKQKWKEEYELALENVKTATSENSIECMEKLERIEKLEWLCEYYEKTRALARKITEWAMNPDNRMYVNRIGDTNNHLLHNFNTDNQNIHQKVPLVICTGGGPGLMEAANRGALDVPNGRSMGMGITLSHEPELNPYVTPELGFEFHYFFTRKFWMVFCTLALVATPGGFGTLDELFEVLTLKQTKKVKKDIPVVLLGKDYWKKIVNWDFMVETGVIAKRDKDQLFFTDDVDEAFEHIINYLKSTEAIIEKPSFTNHTFSK